MRKPLEEKIWKITQCASGFGEWESNGSAFVRRDSIKDFPEADGLVRNQTGKCVRGETWDGVEVVGMLVG